MCVCVGVCDCVGVCVIVWVGVGVIALVRKGVCGCDSLDCCLKVCTVHVCVCQGRGEEGKGECMCGCV